METGICITCKKPIPGGGHTDSCTGLPWLGVDIGGVIISNGPGHDEAFFGQNLRYRDRRPYHEQSMLAVPEVPGSVEAIARLMDLFGGRVYLISKAGKNTEKKTLRWFDHHDFYRRTGMNINHAAFCRDWDGKELSARG